MIILLLVHWGLLPLPLLYLSTYFERHRQDYYDLLMAVSERSAWTDWLQFFLTGIIEQSRDAILRAKQLQDLGKEWHERVHSAHGTGIMHSAVDVLLERPFLTATDLVGQFEITHPTAMRILHRLQDLGILSEHTGKKRNQQYLATEIMIVLTQ